MAFQAPLPPASHTQPAPTREQSDNAAHLQPQAIEEALEHIIFPAARHNRRASQEQQSRSVGLSRLSDCGSLNSVPRTGDESPAGWEATLGSVGEDDYDEWDSLDDGLPAFEETSFPFRSEHLEHSNSVFPRHDGLGTFQASSLAAQDRIWQFERHNPKRASGSALAHHRRPSSVKRKLDQLEDEDTLQVEDQKRERIEQWRLEHSRVLLDEIERETRRRQSFAISQKSVVVGDLGAGQQTPTAGGPQSATGTKPEHVSPASIQDDDESFVERITRRVIRDVIGIDDRTLSILFGEALPDEHDRNCSSHAVTTSSESPQPTPGLIPWQSRFLSRLARELGFLIGHFSDQPHRDSASMPLNTAHLDYAGLAITTPTSSKSHPPGHSLRSPFIDLDSSSQPATALNTQHAASWGVDDTPLFPSPPPNQSDTPQREESPNLSRVLNILRAHFTNSNPSPSSNLSSRDTPPAPPSQSSILRRATLIRQLHPLANSSTHHLHRYDTPPSRTRRATQRRHGHYAASSCGSQSLRRSGRGTPMTTTATTTSVASYYGGGAGEGGSSRNFWDIGGTGWGEV